MKSFAGKSALITGGTRGIGFALAQALSARGARLALVGTDEARTAEASAQIRASGGFARGYVLDVTDAAGWQRLALDVEKDFGPLDILALNAGGQGSRRNIEDISPEEWRWVWSVNVDGVYNGLRTFLPDMRRRNAEGHVIITSSIAALIPRASVSAYGAAKAASLAIGEALRLELAGTPIGVSVLCPALVQTSFRETNQRHAPGADSSTFDYMVVGPDQGMAASDYADHVLKAVEEERFYVFTHPALHPLAIEVLESKKAALLSAGPVPSGDR